MASDGTQGDLAGEDEEQVRQYIEQLLADTSNPGGSTDPTAAGYAGGPWQLPVVRPPTPAIGGGVSVAGSRVHLQMTPQDAGIFGEGGFSGFGQPGSDDQQTAVVVEAVGDFAVLPTTSTAMSLPGFAGRQAAVMAQDAGLFDEGGRTVGARLPVPLSVADFVGPAGVGIATWNDGGGRLPFEMMPVTAGGELLPLSIEEMLQGLNLQPQPPE